VEAGNGQIPEKMMPCFSLSLLSFRVAKSHQKVRTGLVGLEQFDFLKMLQSMPSLYASWLKIVV
jgi:hypothetical protein